MGVPAEDIIVERRATNTGENVRFTYDLLAGMEGTDEKGTLLDEIKRFILVQKPYMERRTYATFVKQWPSSPSSAGGSGDGGPEFYVTSPPLEWHEYPDEDNPRDLVINAMVGDLVRIRDYPAKGYQIPQEIPDDVSHAAEMLMQVGYSSHLP